jgi:hypothetical protein
MYGIGTLEMIVLNRVILSRIISVADIGLAVDIVLEVNSALDA